MEYHKQRTRYYVARYGYSPQIYTWELMSEPLHMDEFNTGTTLSVNGTTIENKPAQVLSHPNFLTAINAINAYHNTISSYIKNELLDKDHLITMSISPLENIESHFLSSMANPNIDILGYHLYSKRSDKWVIAKEGNNNGKENIVFGNPGNVETSLYKSIHYIQNYDQGQFNKPIILSEVGHDWERDCMRITGNVIDAMTGGFCGIAGMHPWSGYSYGGNDEIFDDRLLWASSIASENYMNTDKVISTLDHWNGLWKQGRQEQFVKNNNVEFPKELQYYIAESKEKATGYVRNRSYNVWTNRLNNSCESLENTSSFAFPLNSFYPFSWDTGNNHLYVYPLEKKTYYTIKWYDFLSGNLIDQQTYETKGDGRFKLEYPNLTLEDPLRPILWFSMEKAIGNRMAAESEEKDIFETQTQNLSLFPNPFTDEFTVYSLDEDEIDIYYTTGVLVAHYKLNSGETSIDLKNLANGVYFVYSAKTGQVIKIMKK